MIDYLIVGASHAALAAVAAIRMHDPAGSITMLSKDDALPYSPTVLPYVVSGRSKPDSISLRDDAYFSSHQVDYIRGRTLAKVDAAANLVRLSSGEEIGFAKLLLATGAAPLLPPIPGLDSVDFHVLRTLSDARDLRDALPQTASAVVLGGGLIGMHAAENLATAGVDVTVVEMQRHVLPGYFDAAAAAIIEAVFIVKGVRLLLGSSVVKLSPRTKQGVHLCLADGSEIDADLLLVATGVAPVMDYLEGSGTATDRGILVDDCMRTSVGNIWAAGDVAQARGFYDGKNVINGILPSAVEQGRIAGMAMAGDPALPKYPGAVPLNTYAFFGQRAVSVGSQGDGEVVVAESDLESRRYLKIVMKEGRLTGIFGINVPFDPGVMWQLILRRVDLTPVRDKFIADPQQTARVLMSQIWR
jgi:phenylglyoxylate dehydrogenase epsilon subunit